MSGDNATQEIIIVRRGGDGDHGHHGGAWKIAFADFMTAMMALFLVLWLVNAANEETKKSVASYFNPVKLVDRNRSEKGLSTPQSAPSLTPAGESEASSAESVEDGDLAASADAEFFENPEEALDEIVEEDAQSLSPAGEIGIESGGFESLNDDSATQPAFVDPFSPAYWEPEDEQKTTEAEVVEGQGPPKEMADEALDAKVNLEPLTRDDVQKIMDTKENVAPEEEVPTREMEPVENKEEAEVQEPTPAEELASEVENSLEDVLSALGLEQDQVSVVPQNESVLISLADDLNFSMFGVGSAVPKAELVNAVDAIGSELSEKKVAISIVGHTDGRPYRSGVYDNWRLSAARAQATLYMLVRGGVKEDKIVSVSGRADRKLKNTTDPFAAENRRIDILVELENQ